MQTSVYALGRLMKVSALVAAVAALVAACGGGSSGSIPLPVINKVKVMGDSLADVGTFGFRFSVQGTATAPQPIFTERVAQAYGLTTQQCAFYTFNGTTFVASPTAGCTNFAVGGGRINGATAGMAANDPRIIVNQLQASVAAGNHAATDLLLVDGGGNDAADVVGLYLAIGAAAAGTPAQAAAVTAYAQALNSIPLGTTLNLTTAEGLAQAGGIYMRALAGRFVDQIKTNAIDKGAKQVALINMPAITLTPRFQTVLAGVGAAGGAGARAAATTLFDNWVAAFNAELAAKTAGNPNLLLIDLNTSFKSWVANPASFGLTNVTDPACPAIGTDSNGLPTYSLPTCSATALSNRTPPAGATGGTGWWNTYLYSDNFHPTPLGHDLAFQQIRLALFNNSWL